MEETVFELAKTLGRVSAGDQEALRPLCAHAVQELRGRLREGITEEDCGGAFPLAAAWLALAGLCAGNAAGNVESFTAGSLTIRRASGGDSRSRAAGLRAQAELMMGRYLRDEGFSFRGVR